MTLMRSRPHSYGACLALILFLSGCEKPGELLNGIQHSKTDYPITRTITDNKGRPLEATIIGRDTTSITVIRKSDGTRFAIPYERLSVPDQAFVLKLPLHDATPSPAGTDTVSTPTDSSERGIIGFRRNRLRELDERIRANDNLLYQIGPNTVKGRSLMSENERLVKERAGITQEIHELESR